MFFILGWLLLMLMALCWSVDDSIVLILGCSAAYFIFLGFYSMPRTSRPGKWNKSEGWDGHTSTANFGDILKNLFSRIGNQSATTAKGFTVPKADQKRRRVAPLIFMAIFVSFFIFIIGIILSSPDYESDWGDFYNRAETQFVQGDYDSAYINYRRAWKSDETNAEAMVGYANILAIRNQQDSAAVMYDKAFEVNPEYLGAIYSKGAMYYNLERYGECIAAMDPLLRENPDYYDGMLLIGDCYYSLKQFDDALVWYENAYENGGSRGSALCHIMAYIYDTKGDYSKAISFYQEALQYDSSIVSIYKRLGELIPNEDGNFYRTQAVKLEQ